MKLSLFARLEQLLRVICLILFLAAVITTTLVQQMLIPIFPFINKLTGHYFTKDRKSVPMHVYFQKYFELGMFKLLGIDYIVENRVSMFLKCSG